MDCKSCKPYFWGMCIGLLQIPAFLSAGSLGLSTTYKNAVCFFQNIHNFSSCFETPRDVWQLGMILGIVIGAFLGKMLAGYKTPSLDKESSTRIDPSWKKTMLSYTLLKRLSFAFIGGFFLLLGANFASGCTSGNGISGLALLFVGSYVVMASTFLFGTLAAFILYRRA